jgi:transposase InsO family protein
MALRDLVGRAKRRRKRTTIADPAAKAQADLLQRNFAPQAHPLDTLWCTRHAREGRAGPEPGWP